MKLQTLGALTLEPTSFTQPKPLLLLSYLVIEGPQPRRHVAELFWQTGNRMKSLSMTLTRLRQGAGEIIGADESRVWATLESDAKLLLHALDKSDWDNATRLYTGAFLEGVVLEEWSAELEEWVYTTREYLAERVQYALLNLAEASAKQQDFSHSSRLAEHAYKLPGAATPEPSTLKRLYTLLSAGRSLHAPEVRKSMESYGFTVTLTTDEARASFKPAPSTHVLPMRGTSFVGRDSELSELARLLAQENCQLLTLLGSAGLGKTRLALQFAYEQQTLGNYQDGVYFVALESFSDASSLPSHLAQHLGFTLESHSELPQQLVTFLENKQILIVLDNFEHLVSAAPLFSSLVQRCSGLKILVTSRERLNIEEEHLFLLEGLPFPSRAASGQDAHTYDALQLFEQRAKQLDPDFNFDDELPHVITICQLVEGSPLGLELAAGWIRLMPCAEIAREIQTNLDFLASTSRTTPDRHRSLRAAFDYSWKLLSPKEQDVLAKLSAFRGGFRREAASEVAGATIPLLASLVDKSLLRVLSNGRYDQHPLVYQYAREKLLEQGKFSKAQSAHLRYYLGLVQAQEEAVQRGEQQDALRIFHEEWDNCNVVAEKILESRDSALLLRWVDLVDTFYDVRGAYTEALAFLSRAEAILTDNPKLLGRVLLEKGYAHAWLGTFNEAQDAVTRGLALIPTERRWQVRGINTLGILAINLGQITEAFRHWHEALSLARATHYTIYEAHLTGNLGSVEAERGNLEASELYHLESLELYQQLGAVNGYAREKIHIAVTYFLQGDLAKAKASVREGLELLRKIEYKLYLPYGLTGLARIEHASGDYEKARDLNLEALALSRETGDKTIETKALIGLALVSAALHDPRAAAAYYQEAMRLARGVGSEALLLGALQAKGELLYALGQLEVAANVLTVVVQHPATISYERKLAQATLARLEKQLSKKQAKAVKTYAQNTSLKTALAIDLELPARLH